MYTGEKVRLREYRKEDAPQAQAYINDPEIKRLLGGPPFLLTLWDEEKWVAQQSARSDNYSFAIETLSDNRYIGGCGINHLDWKNRVVELGIFIGDKAYWDRGYGTDALKVLLRFVFEQLNMHKVSLRVLSFNARAQKVYKRLGFQEEGRLREERFVDGEYYDLVIMGLLKEEYYATKEESK